MSGINYRAELNDALNTIQTLRDQLYCAQDELKVTNSELMQMTLEMDKRVAKRTEELEETNQQLKREIEERKQIEKKLLHNEELFRKYFELGQVGMAMTSVEKGWLKVNDYLCRMMGYSREELMQMTWAEMTYPDDLEPDLYQFNRMLKSEIDSYSMDKRFLRKNGEILYTFLSVSCVRKEDGSVDYVIAHLQDITDKMKIEITLRERTKDLERSNKELEQFAYVASHDLQEPLRKISSFTELFVRRFPDLVDEKGRKYISYILDGARRMQKLIQDLLLYSRVGRMNVDFQEVNLNEIIGKIKQDYSKLIAIKHVKLIVHSLPVVMVNPTGIYQVFQNLIGNAIKFNQSDRPQVIISAKREEEKWLFCVEDNGIGIEPEYQERIFIIFQRLHTREEYAGTGIGLSVCKKIIEQRGGRIWIESEIGVETKFFFTIPDYLI